MQVKVTWTETAIYTSTIEVDEEDVNFTYRNLVDWFNDREEWINQVDWLKDCQSVADRDVTEAEEI